jgi:hypothetical protein
MRDIIIQDVAECFAKNTDDKAYFFGLTSSNDITQTIAQNPIKGGIGNGIISLIQSEKEIKFTVVNAIHNDDIYAIQSGTEFTSGSYTVQKTEKCELATGKLTLTGTPVGTSAIVIDPEGTQTTGTIETKAITITGGTDGDEYTVIYGESVTGQILDLKSDAFPKNHYVEMHTIGYDPESNAVVCDIYWVFDKALPDGGLKASLKAGTNATDEITFTAQLSKGSKSYGKYIVIPREAA